MNGFLALRFPDGACHPASPDPGQKDTPSALNGHSLTERAQRDSAAAWVLPEGAAERPQSGDSRTALGSRAPTRRGAGRRPEKGGSGWDKREKGGAHIADTQPPRN